jgi:putative DNA primase/helicase
MIISNSSRLIPTKERARGRWREILPALGIGDDFLTGRNCPCPICGGTDRFRFIDRRGKDGDGMWVCNQCQPKPKPAIDLVIAFTGKPFAEAARLVDMLLGNTYSATPPKPKEEKAASTSYPDRVWRRGVPVRAGDIVDQYLQRRGVGMDIYPLCLRTSALDWYRDDETGTTSRYPAMFAKVCNSVGKPVAVHRTFLASDASGKAQVKSPRKAAGSLGRSPNIRLMPAAPVMGIAEGIETALSAALLFKTPTWPVICAYGIETFEPPPECEQLVIFADNDVHGRGLQAAETLEARLRERMRVHIRLPHLKDWNDVLLEAKR